MNALRAMLLKLAAATPGGVKQRVYARPRLLRPLARLLKRVVPADGGAVITVPHGPNRGMRLAVDRATPNYYWLNASYEGPVESSLRALIRPGMVVADVGAHIGWDTLTFSRLVGERGRVLSFEPDPGSMRRLRRNCELNALSNVTLLPIAVSDRSGEARFAAEEEATSHLLAAGESPAAAPTVTVPCARLDDVLFGRPAAGPPRLDVVKIDVEDHEPAVLRGAPRVLSELRPRVVVEIHSPASLVACVAELKRHGYALVALDDDGTYRKALAGAGADEIAAGPFRRGHLLGNPPP